jgi:hypothetical protein
VKKIKTKADGYLFTLLKVQWHENKMARHALEHAALASGGDDAREARRAAAVQLRHARHTPAGSRRRRLPIDK